MLVRRPFSAEEDLSWLGLITSLGLTSGLESVYDLGDIRCYDDTVDTQTLFDTSGGIDCHFGPTSGVEAQDPAFNGTPGDLSSAEFASTSGNDYFRVKSQPAFIHNYHQNNALFACNGYVYIPTGAASGGIWGTYSNSTASYIGCAIQITTGRKLAFLVSKAAGSVAFGYTTTAAMPADTPAYFGLSVDEAANTLTFDINGTQETVACTYATPSASNASYNLEIMARGNGTVPVPGNFRTYGMAFWDGVVLSATNHTDFRTEIDKRFA